MFPVQLKFTILNILKTLDEVADSPALGMKFECPIYDYTNVQVELPVSGSGSVAKGWGHQYGLNSPSKEGVCLELADVPDSELHTPEHTGSLADLLGMKKGIKKLGQASKIKKVHEAVVAIPYRVDKQNKEQFFKIPFDLMQAAYGESLRKTTGSPTGTNSSLPSGDLPHKLRSQGSTKASKLITNLAQQIRKYVFPPRFSWIRSTPDFDSAMEEARDKAYDAILDKDRMMFDNRADMENAKAAERISANTAALSHAMPPIVMYVFEFSHQFNEDDMQNMWQNLPPKSLMYARKRAKTNLSVDVQSSEVKISHELLPSEFFAADMSSGVEYHNLIGHGKQTTISSDINWLVFKVKQRAANSYKAQALKHNPINQLAGWSYDKAVDFSFNWPYDYFSMVELIKLKEELEF